jgi:glycosyltransferase involved in cell wall biosynthesis
MAPEYSIVIPVYNEAEVLIPLYERLTEVMVGIGAPYEVIFVNDGSKDASLMLMRELHAKDEHVKFVSLSRSFGHQTAVTAGLDHSSSEAVVVMDADVQAPKVIPELIAKWREGFEVVIAVREGRKGETPFKPGDSSAVPSASPSAHLDRDLSGWRRFPADASEGRQRAAHSEGTQSLHAGSGKLSWVPLEIREVHERCPACW